MLYDVLYITECHVIYNSIYQYVIIIALYHDNAIFGV